MTKLRNGNLKFKNCLFIFCKKQKTSKFIKKALILLFIDAKAIQKISLALFKNVNNYSYVIAK